jgi:hypothetical protein
MSYSRSGGRAYYQRYAFPDDTLLVNLKMNGWVWWQLIAVSAVLQGGAADDAVALSIFNSSGGPMMNAGLTLIIKAGNQNQFQMAVNLPPGGIPEQTALLTNVALANTCIFGPIPDLEMEQDGTLDLESVAGEITFSEVQITIRGHRVGDP